MEKELCGPSEGLSSRSLHLNNFVTLISHYTTHRLVFISHKMELILTAQTSAQILRKIWTIMVFCGSGSTCQTITYILNANYD